MNEVVTLTIILILALIMLMLAFTKSMALQHFGLTGLLILAAVVLSAGYGYKQSSDMMTLEYAEVISAQLSKVNSYMKELEEAESEETNGALELYSNLGTTLAENVIGTDGRSKSTFESAVLVKRNTDGKYEECYTVGDDSNFWKEVQDDSVDVIDDAMAAGTAAYQECKDGSIICAVAASDTVTPQFAVVLQTIPDELENKISDVRQDYLVYGGIFLAVALLCSLLLVILQHKDVRRMINIMRRVAEKRESAQIFSGKTLENKVKSNEMRTLCSGLKQIATDNQRINYDKYKALQVYYRFAPKDIEKIMGKSSILDVKVNEQVKLESTLAYISFNINERLKQHEQLHDINEYYMKLGRVRNQHNGIIINSSTDLSTIQMIFNEMASDAVQFGIDMVSDDAQTAESAPVLVLLHRTSFVYGISGDDEQTFAFAHSVEMKEIEKHVEQLRRMGVRMAVTDYVKEMLPAETQQRYIGYITGQGMKFNFYEILDAYPAKERQQRIDTHEKFDEAMKLFYQSDFFFARTLFTEILKDCPHDDVTKHYIFRCESCLNGQDFKDDRFALL